MSKKNLKYLLIAVVLLVSLIGTLIQWPHPNTVKVTPQEPNVAGVETTIGQQTKTSNCIITGILPDPACTPGAIIQTATVEQICVPGYSKDVRNVPNTLKEQAFTEYGISTHSTGEYEVDHLISLELGGSNDIANLWPESSEPRPGFHEKDRVENYLHQMVCDRSITLVEAQRIISSDWTQVLGFLPKQ